MNIREQLEEGMKSVFVSEKYKQAAIKNIERWLTEEQFADYKEQILFLIKQKNFSILLDSFYQVIPFGTGGRRGPVGIGPNRINPWTMQASAQGHAEYLLKKYKDAKERGVAIAYDVRKYPDKHFYDTTKKNPVKGITSKDFAEAAVEVYTANGIKVYLFEEIRTTPELSFAVRNLGAVAGVVMSASHNPKEDNGKKIYGHDGGQLLPPEDQIVADTVNSVQEIKKTANPSLIKMIGKKVDAAYLQAIHYATACAPKTENKKDLKIIFTPLHGVGSTNVYKTLVQEGFSVIEDEATKTPDGFFSNVKFNIPNPEVQESFETCYQSEEAKDADIIFASDPDADRLGLSVKHNNVWHYLNGNEIGILLLASILEEKKRRKELSEVSQEHFVIKTAVTSSLQTAIAKAYNVTMIGELLVGFKYIGNEIAKLEKNSKQNTFLLGMEESHGYLVGTYARDKDAAGAAVVLAAKAAVQKEKGATLIDSLNEIYKEYGYADNHLTSIIMQGAAGIEKIAKIQEVLRKEQPKKIGKFTVKKMEDMWQGSPHLSETDIASRNMLVFHLEPAEENIISMKITVRPSGTEPKTKIYLEVIAKPVGRNATEAMLKEQKQQCEKIKKEMKTAILKKAYEIVGINLPERGYLLSDLLSAEVKKKYFEIEKELLQEKEMFMSGKLSKQDYKNKIEFLLFSFGADPIEKVDACFKAEHKISLREYFEL